MMKQLSLTFPSCGREGAQTESSCSSPPDELKGLGQKATIPIEKAPTDTLDFHRKRQENKYELTNVSVLLSIHLLHIINTRKSLPLLLV